MKVSYKAIGRNMRHIRMEAGLTQANAAEIMRISVLHYGRIERGERRASLDELHLFAQQMDTSVMTLLRGSSEFLIREEVPCGFGEIVELLADGCSDEAKAMMLDVCRVIAGRDKCMLNQTNR